MLKYIFPLTLLFVSCESNEKLADKSAKKETPKVVVSFENEGDMDERVVEIEAIIKNVDQIATSLYYSKEGGSFLQINGHMNADNVIMKIEEQFSDGEGKNHGVRYFYLNDGKPFISIERMEDISSGKPQFIDRLSYYDEKGNTLKTKQRVADYEELVDEMKYTAAPLKAVSIDRSMRALNQEGEFQTTFQGFIDQDVFTYLIVGENKKDGYSSALRCDFKDKLINTLKMDERGNIGKLLRVNYEKYTDETGFEFQIYAGGSMK